MPELKFGPTYRDDRRATTGRATTLVVAADSLAAAGVVIGVGASMGLMRLLSELLFGVNPNDVVILGAAGGVLFASAPIANWWPARRAARVDPVLLPRQD